MKHLVEQHPQDFVSWLHKGAQVEGILKQELQQTLYADSLIKIWLHGQAAIAHFEFQSARDAHMGERLLTYNVLASRANDHLPVWSHVIYLRPDSDLEEPPHTRLFPDNREIYHFNYDQIELWTMTAEELLALPLDGLLPLTLLTKDGTETGRVEEMIEQLGSIADKDLLVAAYTLGGLVFKDQERHDWFKRRFHMFHDILEESWTYQEMRQEIEEKVTAQVEAQAKAKVAAAEAKMVAVEAKMVAVEAKAQERIDRELARIESLQHRLLQRSRITLVNIAEKRFPTITRLVQGMSNAISDLDILADLIVDVSIAQTADEVTELVLAAIERSVDNEQEALNRDE